jgi:hypothetical protein
MNKFGIIALGHRPVSAERLAERTEMVERHRRLIPAARVPVIDRWLAYWRHELASPGQVRDTM